MTTWMRSTSAAMVLWAALGSGLGAQEAEVPPVVDAGWLAERLGDPDLVVVQVGPGETYARAHPPGARSVELDALTAPMPDDGDHSRHLVLELPEWESLRSALEGLGISDGSTVVVLPSDGWLTPAARVVFTLDYAGFGRRVALLDGGLEAWRGAGHPVTDVRPPPTSGRIAGAPAPDRVVTTEWVRRNGRASGVALVDARPGAFYDGVRADRGKEGHIPGAVSLPWTDLVREDEATGAVFLRPVDELRGLFAEAGVGPGETVVAYCHIGQYASLAILAARRLGHPTRLYDGSMNEWALEDLPVEAGGRP